jgi:hypothetical protein
MRSGEVVVADGFVFELVGGDELHPRPDSRRIEDLTGSIALPFGELFEIIRRSRSGVSGRGLDVLIVGTTASTTAAATNGGRQC